MKAAALLLAAICLLTGCAAPAIRAPAATSPAPERCFALFEAVDAATERAGVGDAQATRIPGFPYLRVDRLLASLRLELPDEAATRFWLERLGDLDAEAREHELANLPTEALADLQAAAEDGHGSLSPALAACRSRLLAEDATHPSRLAVLQEAAVVPDDYSTTLRIAGLYALTRIPFAAGVRRFEREVEASFALPLERLPRHGTAERFAPPPGPPTGRLETARALARAAANPLSIPDLPPEELRRLALAHAPVLEVDVVDENDRIGTPAWPAAGPARVDTLQPRLFYRAAHTRLGGRILLQLVYTAWFPARPRSGTFDLLGGHLDALVWRVTLSPDGAPLVFDTIHGCGCYHFFFPTPALRPRAHRPGIEEWMFVPATLPPPGEDERTVLHLAARTHYLERVRFEPRIAHTPGTTYGLVPDDALRSLPHPDGSRRSLYRPDGMVAGSERAERFLFWPMGVRSPGAMRQWGRHATAFVGRRHFDDPYLMDARFEPAEGTPAPSSAPPGGLAP